MFSALQAVLARPLPYPDAGNLVQVFRMRLTEHVRFRLTNKLLHRCAGLQKG
jgi:hypothetical protein